MKRAFALYRKEMKGNFRLFIIPVVLMFISIVLKYIYYEIFAVSKTNPFIYFL